jgi:hypothetical protein
VELVPCAAVTLPFVQVILDYLANQEVFLGQRTLEYWNHSGMWTTETTHLTGAYDQSDYGASMVALCPVLQQFIFGCVTRHFTRGCIAGCEGSREGWPVWLMKSGEEHCWWLRECVRAMLRSRAEADYLHLDWGGDSGTGEFALMALDYLLWTGNATAAQPYLGIAFQAANFFMHHFAGSSPSTDKIVIAPAQVLEVRVLIVQRQRVECDVECRPTGATGTSHLRTSQTAALTTRQQSAACCLCSKSCCSCPTHSLHSSSATNGLYSSGASPHSPSTPLQNPFCQLASSAPAHTTAKAQSCA